MIRIKFIEGFELILKADGSFIFYDKEGEEIFNDDGFKVGGNSRASERVSTMREILQELYEHKENLPLLSKLIKPLLNDSFYKGDMLKEIERIEKKKLNIDFTIPKEFSDQLDIVGIDSTFFVWSYENVRLGGRPLNLLERYFKALCKELSK